VILQCKNCTTTGKLELVEGNFNINTTQNSTEVENIIHFFDGGFVAFSANDMTAHIELEVSLQPGFAIGPFIAHLPTLAIPGFQVVTVCSSPKDSRQY
jgi:hypothetical protein